MSDFGFVSVANINTGLTFKGTWDALTNNPFLQSGVGVGGEYYIVSVAGNTNLDGVTDWQIGDWAIFESATNMWQKVDNHDVQAYSTIQEEGVNLTQQNILDFQGAGVTASNGTGKTIVTIPIQPAYSTIQDEGSPLTQRTTINFTGAISATDSGGVTVVNVPATTSYGLFAQTANISPITGTIVETSLINGGVGTLSVPPNGFSVGDSFQAIMGGVISSANAQTITIRIKSGSVILADSGALSLPNITDQVFNLTISFTIRAIGGAGVSNIVTLANLLILKKTSGNQDGYGWNVVNQTTFDTTIPNTLDITAQWSSTNATNSIYSDIFVLNKIY